LKEGTAEMATGTSGSNRPSGSAFKQQRLKAWQPILTPPAVIGTLGAIAVLFIAIGAAVLSSSSGVVEVSVRYDQACSSKLTPWNKMTDEPCVVEFQLDDDSKWETEEVTAYYQLDNFFQNHRRYVASRSAHQLYGTSMQLDKNDVMTADPGGKGVDDCKYQMSYKDPAGTPAVSTDDVTVYQYPCGLVSWSMFNDTLMIREKGTKKYVMWNDANKVCPGYNGTVPCPSNPGGIAWKSDVEKKYRSPPPEWIASNCRYIGGKDMSTSGFIHPKLFDNTVLKLQNASDTDCGAPACGMRVLKLDGTPNSGIYNCWHNTTDEDFVVWMRVAALPTFRKVYRRIPKGALKKNIKYELVVMNRFPVAAFSGQKSFFLSTKTFVGGKNDFLGYAYIVVGALCALLGLCFMGKHLVSPRIMGDPRYLHWK